jgi:hypothetical protein
MKVIFQKEPAQWGFRGDPYLWRDLQEYMCSAKQPQNEEAFEKLFKEAFAHLTGKELERNSMIYVEKYNHGGMSGGRIAVEFWVDTGLPLLKKRFREMNKKG